MDNFHTWCRETSRRVGNNYNSVYAHINCVLALVKFVQAVFLPPHLIISAMRTEGEGLRTRLG